MENFMRISLVLAREDNPKLFDELAQFPKGPRRVNRLRTLAYDGVLAQCSMTVASVAPTGSPRGRIPASQTERLQASLDLFAEPQGES